MHPSISAAKELVVPDTGNRNQPSIIILANSPNSMNRFRESWMPDKRASIVIEAKPNLSEKKKTIQ
jgi:hypothetical protein